MRVYLVRHGEAEDGSHDDRRALNKQGIAEVKKMAEFFKRSQHPIKTIYYSTKLRAQQTAEILKTGLAGQVELKQREGLCPNDPVEDIARWLDKEEHSLMLVGHMPFMGELTAYLVARNHNSALVHYQTGCVVILEKNNSTWSISAMINPKYLA